MSPQISQPELSGYVADGNTIIINFRRAYDIQYSKGINGYVLRQVYRKYCGLPFTGRGSYMAVTPGSFHKMVNKNNSNSN